MKALLLIAALLATLAVASASHQALWAGFKEKYSKSYPSPAEEQKRFDIFSRNMLIARGMQAMNPLATFGVNAFSDLSAEEFAAYHSGRKHFAAAVAKAAGEPAVTASAPAAGDKVDWRTKGVVTAVKNQGQCGSCWAFSSTGNIEGQHALKHKQLVSLSEQELVSCDTIDDGCNGGLMDNAFDWLVKDKKGEIVTEASYPYASGSGFAPSCDLSGKKVGAKITGHKNIVKTEKAMADWVFENGPLSIAVDATSWQTYTSGVMTNCISQQIDHGVLIVGFDLAAKPAYWIIKNSWAASWGENGYIRVEYGKDECLLTSYPCSSISA